ncbi:MAG: hypothetical protein JXR69_11260 [Candidatus Delongbacteria bacterium]|nr:hypothetical protein [Candidatus Delongbacteria bacterium]
MVLFETDYNSTSLSYENMSDLIAPEYDLSTCANASIKFDLNHTIDFSMMLNYDLCLEINNSIFEGYYLDQYPKNQWIEISTNIDESDLVNSFNVKIKSLLVSIEQDSILFDNFQITAVQADPPSNIIVTRNETSTVLTWDAVTNAINYYVYRSDKPDIDYVEIGTATSETFTDNSVFEDGVYFYKIVTEIEIQTKEGGK